eukprot:m.411298 g.411298  ORF g.411298 m.411298 type:complete len:430 (-) comp20164_c1_seq4:73-1362(-)
MIRFAAGVRGLNVAMTIGDVATRDMTQTDHRCNVDMASLPLLFTPGPLTVSDTVKKAMLCDYGSRDPTFLAIVKEVQRGLLSVGQVTDQEADDDKAFECVLLQGSGTYVVEAVVSSAVPRDGKLAILINGAYGRRVVQMATRLGVNFVPVEFSETQAMDLEEIRSALAQDATITHVLCVHSETTSGILNPIATIGKLIQEVLPTAEFIVDAMSSFGGIEMNIADTGADFLVSSANKCIQGVPGFAYVIARRSSLKKTQGCARVLTLDLYDQWQFFQTKGQFRYTPPTHAVVALKTALDELEAEGGVAVRTQRYRRNQSLIRKGFSKLGFGMLLPEELQGTCITSVCFPTVEGSDEIHPQWDFETFYQSLGKRGFALYPGKVTQAPSFRVGNIGHLFEADVRAMIAAAAAVLVDMSICQADQITWVESEW